MMRKLLALFTVILLAFAALSNAQIASYSGGTINIGVVPAATATAFSDTATATHADVVQAMNDVTGLLNSVTGDSTLTKAVRDSLTATHSALETRAKTLKDTLTVVHGKLYDVDEAIEDSITAARVEIENLKASITADSALIVSTNTMMGVYSGTTGGHMEMPDVPVTIDAISTGDTDVLYLHTADTRYLVRSLWLKCVDPGANTVTVTLKILINDIATVVDTFDITTANYTVYYKLPSLFEVEQLAGDDIQVYVRSSAGTYAVTGQYSYAKTNN